MNAVQLRCLQILIGIFGVGFVSRGAQAIGPAFLQRRVAPRLSSLFAGLARPAAAADYTRAVFRKWPALWSAALAARYQLAIGDMSEAAAIVEQASRAFDAGKRDLHWADVLHDAETIVALEQGELELEEIAGALCGRKVIARFYRERAVRFDSLGRQHAVVPCIKAFCAAIGYDPEQTVEACEAYLAPQGCWEDVLGLLQEATTCLEERRAVYGTGMFARRGANDARMDRRIASLRAFAAIAQGDTQALKAIFEGPHAEAAELQLPRALHLAQAGHCERAAQAISRFQRHARTSPGVSDRLTISVVEYVGRGWERAGRQVPAAEFYKRAMQMSQSADKGLTSATWRFVSTLCAQGQKSRATNLLGLGVARVWTAYRRYTRTPFVQKLRTGRFLPRSGAILVGGRTPHEEIARAAMLAGTPDKLAEATYYVDPSLVKLWTRSFPGMTMVARQGLDGGSAVSEPAFWRARDGLPRDVDRVRFTREITEAAQRKRTLALSEDLLCEWSGAAAKRKPQEIVLRTNPEPPQAMREWLDGLPTGTCIGICVQPDRIGSAQSSGKSVLDSWGQQIDRLGLSVLKIEPDHDRRIEKGGCYRITRCGAGNEAALKLSDDLDELATLCSRLEMVIGEDQLVCDLAAAVGTPTFSVHSFPALIERWRTHEDGRDRLFARLQHLSVCDDTGANVLPPQILKRLEQLVDGAELGHAEALVHAGA